MVDFARKKPEAKASPPRAELIRQRVRPQHATLLNLQETAGNSAVGHALRHHPLPVQRQSAPAANTPESLLSRFHSQVTARAIDLAVATLFGFPEIFGTGIRTGNVDIWSELTLTRHGDMDLHYRNQGQNQDHHVKIRLRAGVLRGKVYVRAEIVTWDRGGELPVAAKRFLLSQDGISEVPLSPGRGGGREDDENVQV